MRVKILMKFLGQALRSPIMCINNFKLLAPFLSLQWRLTERNRRRSVKQRKTELPPRLRWSSASELPGASHGLTSGHGKGRPRFSSLPEIQLHSGFSAFSSDWPWSTTSWMKGDFLSVLFICLNFCSFVYPCTFFHPCLFVILSHLFVLLVRSFVYLHFLVHLIILVHLFNVHPCAFVNPSSFVHSMLQLILSYSQLLGHF